MKRRLSILLLAVGLPAAPSVAQGDRIDGAQTLSDLRLLSADSMEGRVVGSEGNRKARQFIIDEFTRIGLESFGDGYGQSFALERGGERQNGTNVVGFVRGTANPERYIVLSAHYDHLGVRDQEIYNGADDNASGTAGLLAMARVLAANPPRHSVIFVAFDAEEGGLRGAHAFVTSPPVKLENIAINVNMDMVSHSDRELVAAGTHHYPFLKQYVDAVEPSVPVVIEYGHDSPGLPPGQDWTGSSDHGPFHDAGIPFLYFGVEDHDDYHRPTDDFDTINRRFYVAAIETILAVVRELDANLAAITR